MTIIAEKILEQALHLATYFTREQVEKVVDEVKVEVRASKVPTNAKLTYADWGFIADESKRKLEERLMLNHNKISKKGTKVKAPTPAAPKKLPKPRSLLQQQNQQAQFAQHFLLQRFNPCAVSKLVVSPTTQHLINKHNLNVEALKISIAQDYEATKEAHKVNISVWDKYSEEQLAKMKKPRKTVTNPARLGNAIYGTVDGEQVKLSKSVITSMVHIETLNTIYTIVWTDEVLKSQWEPDIPF